MTGRNKSKYHQFSDLHLFRLRRLPNDELISLLDAPSYQAVKSLYKYRKVPLPYSRAKVVRPSVKETAGIGVLVAPARLGVSGCEGYEVDERFGEKERCPYREECGRQFREFGVMGCEEVGEEEARELWEVRNGR